MLLASHSWSVSCMCSYFIGEHGGMGKLELSEMSFVRWCQMYLSFFCWINLTFARRWRLERHPEFWGFMETDKSVPKTMSELTRNGLIPLQLHEFQWLLDLLFWVGRVPFNFNYWQFFVMSPLPPFLVHDVFHVFVSAIATGFHVGSWSWTWTACKDHNGDLCSVLPSRVSWL